MNFLEHVKISHDQYLKELSLLVSDKWKINQQDILDLWNAPTTSSTVVPIKCSHKFTRGKKKGTECDLPAVEEGMCKKHVKKKTGKKKPGKKKPRLVMRKHKVFTEYFYHKETRFVLKTKKAGVVGKLDDEEEKILPLDTKDKEKCEELGLKVNSD